MNKDQIRFEIDQLRKDKILFAVESVALSILALLVFIAAPSVFPEIINPYLPSSLKILQGVVLLPLVFWIFTLVGNLIRLKKILKLQKTLSGKKK
ncbi:hypothetical protein ISR94_03030 [Candidatus Microgenomates bacterium]|nr:hypothetical protein [Candidatus Microgenomates bacterium]